ncbi:MAG: ABC transporter ATP-binding protein [Ardenticatenales bacterium]|nr:ABC transporter ATP-binding protein [Ardenticatenales bacterium]
MNKTEFRVAGARSYNQSSPARWILSHLGQHKGFLLSFIAGISVANLLNSYIPQRIGYAFDVVVAGQDVAAQLWPIALGLIFVAIFRAVADISGQFSMEVIGKRIERDARDELYRNLLGKSQTFHNRQRIGDIMARATNDVREINFMMMPGVALLVDSMFGLVMPIIFMAFIDLRLLVSPLLFCVVFFIALRIYVRELDPISNKMRQKFGTMNAGLNESIAGIEVVKSTAQEPREIFQFIRNAGAYKDFFVKQGVVQARYLPPLLLGAALSGAFLHSIYLLSQDQLSVGEVVTYMVLMGRLRFPTFISIFTFSLVQLGMAGASRILDLMKEETEIDENESLPPADMRGELIFDDVTFGYGGVPVLEGISFRAEPGETVAIVGQTGAGKTTLTKLVNRTYDVTGGRILIDGREVHEWNLASLRSQISIIEQDIFLFSRTVAENIAFGNSEATRADIERVAREAQADGFIRDFQSGYETELGERGVTLSGGQRQRLAIARALLTDPRILILDDATSAIDSATEDRIQTAIDRIQEGRTTLLITHRLSQIRRADKILVLAGGKLLDQGTHHELLDRCELYQRIFQRNLTSQLEGVN